MQRWVARAGLLPFALVSAGLFGCQGLQPPMLDRTELQSFPSTSPMAIRWKGEPRFRGVSQTLAMLIEHLWARRERTVDPGEATGVLTHHLDMDDQSWDFVVRLFEVFRDHPGVAIRSAEDLFVS